ncbi:MAG: hypothetical protein KGN76_10220 [Acidobacteriota bacterium]|nr:hypothetical protein [Acidobacteriota bacterium]
MAFDRTVRPVRALTIHADYACRHSGHCCTAGWAIPVEAPLFRGIAAALAERRLAAPGDLPVAALFDREAARPPDAAALLGTHPSGACVFFDGPPSNLCALQRHGGPAWLPSACRHFPRVALLDARGTSITLSHYCPTAARQLFRTEVPLAVTTAPAAFPATVAYEGFDARKTWPPLLRPGVLSDLDSYDRWEARLVEICADHRRSPEAALLEMGQVTEAIRAWTPACGPLVEHAKALCGAAAPPAPAAEAAAFASLHIAASPALHRLVSASVPPALVAASAPGWSPSVWREQVEPAWHGLAGPIRRYLAARSFASWLAYQGEGLRTVTAGVAAALGVLRVEATRLAARDDRLLDEPLLLEAFRQSDRLLVHLASPEALARALAAAETMSPVAYLEHLGR